MGPLCIARVVSAVIVTVAIAVVTAAQASSTPGPIMLVGGALSDGNADIYGKFVRLA